VQEAPARVLPAACATAHGSFPRLGAEARGYGLEEVFTRADCLEHVELELEALAQDVRLFVLPTRVPPAARCLQLRGGLCVPRDEVVSFVACLVPGVSLW
jgi:hypothetical protein